MQRPEENIDFSIVGPKQTSIYLFIPLVRLLMFSDFAQHSRILSHGDCSIRFKMHVDPKLGSFQELATSRCAFNSNHDLKKENCVALVVAACCSYCMLNFGSKHFQSASLTQR